VALHTMRLRLACVLFAFAAIGSGLAVAQDAQKSFSQPDTPTLLDERRQPESEQTRPEPAAKPEQADGAEKHGDDSTVSSKPAEAKEAATLEPEKTEAATSEPAKTDAGDAKAAAEDVAVQIPTLPADSITHHALDLGGRTLQFDAVAGSIPLTNSDGRIQARVAYISYSLTGGDPRTRPVAFVVNGGPGSSSAWLNLGAIGPWRIPIEGDAARPSAVATLMANSETWLDFTDLVMIDPVGTGFSMIEHDPRQKNGPSRHDLERHYWSVSGDIESISSVISKWLGKTGRHASPKLLVGESYGGFRVPKIAHTLQSDLSIGINLMVMISPVLDFSLIRGQRHLPFNTMTLLPSLAAAALERSGKTPTPALMKEAEDYARGPYLADLMRGPRDKAAVDRIVERVSALTNLPAPIVERYGGRLTSTAYRREANQGSDRIASAYDASITGLNPEPNSPGSHAQDPYLTGLRAPLTNAMLDLYANKLAWRPEASYLIINGDVGNGWQYGNSSTAPEAVSDLKAVLALDDRVRALVVHGYTDLVTPYFADTMILDQLPAYGDGRRVAQVNYPGGHMFYGRDGSRAAFREDVLILLAASLNGEPQTR